MPGIGSEVEGTAVVEKHYCGSIVFDVLENSMQGEEPSWILWERAELQSKANLRGRFRWSRAREQAEGNDPSQSKNFWDRTQRKGGATFEILGESSWRRNRNVTAESLGKIESNGSPVLGPGSEQVLGQDQKHGKKAPSQATIGKESISNTNRMLDTAEYRAWDVLRPENQVIRGVGFVDPVRCPSPRRLMHMQYAFWNRMLV